MADPAIERLRLERARLHQGGGPERLAKQRAAGKLTARERLALLYDPDTFQEWNLWVRHRSTHPDLAGRELPGEGVVTGVGSVGGRPVYAASQDFTVVGGSIGEAGAGKIADLMDAALRSGHPLLVFNDGAGARIQEGVAALDGYGRIFYRNVLLSGVVPQISIIAGPCAGGAAYSPALTDFIIQVASAGQMYITGPSVIREVTGEQVTAEELGGVESHAHYSGVVHFVAADDADAVAIARRLLDFLPANNTEDPPFVAELHEAALYPDDGFSAIVPADPREPYDMREVVRRTVDRADFLEVQAAYAANLVIGFGRVAGRTVGVLANQPMVRAGALDIDASDKAARFIRFCNAFNIPLVTFVDVPGFLPGVAPGVRRHHPPRRQDALRLRRGDRAQGHGRRPQGLRRGLPRDVRQGDGRRPDLRLARRRDRRHGRRGRRARARPQGDRSGARSRRRGRPPRRRVPGDLRRPARRGGARHARRHHRAGGDPGLRRERARGPADQARAAAAEEARPDPDVTARRP